MAQPNEVKLKLGVDGVAAVKSGLKEVTGAIGSANQAAVDGLKTIEKQVAGTVGKLSEALKSIPGLGGWASTLAAFASFGAFKALIGDTVSWAASLNVASLKTGTTVENLSALAKVAKLSGTEMGTVEFGLVRMSKALSGVDEESKGAGHALEAIGLDADVLRKMDPAEVLQAVAKELAKYADDGSKVAFMQDLLGRSGAEMLPIMKDLGEQQGLVGKLTKQQAEEAQHLQREWAKLSNEGAFLAKSIALEMVPKLSEFLEQLTEGKRLTGGFASALWEFGVLLDPMNTVAQNISKTRNEVQKLTAAMAEGRAQNLADMGSTDLSDIDKNLGVQTRRLKFLQLQERQEALAKYSGPEFLDARDIRARTPIRLGYTSVLDRPPTAPKGARSGRAEARDPLDTLLENYRRDAFAQEVGMASSTVREIENLGALLKVGKVDAAEYNKLLDTVLGKDSVLAREQALLDKSRLAQAAMGQSVDNLRDTYQRQTALYDQRQMTAPQRELEAALGKVKDAATAAREALSQKAASLEGDDVNALEAFRAAIVRVNDAEADQITKITALQAEQERLNGLWETGADRALTKYLDSSINVADQVEAAFTKGFQGMEDALMTFVSTGKLSFADLAKSIIADLARIELKAQLRTLLPSSGGSAGGPGGLLGLLSGLFRGTPQAATPASEIAATESWIDAGGLVGGLHAGGVVGIDRTFSRAVHPGLFAGAPRFHGGGLVGGEVPIIARRGEGVFTAAQMQALGQGGGAGGAVTINVHLNGPSDNAAEVRRSAGQGARSAWNALQGSRRYV